MKLLNFDAIIEASDKTFEDIEVPEWGGTVRIAVMSGRDRDRWELSMMQTDNSAKGFKLNFNAYSRSNLIALCLVDENFNRIFVTEEQVNALSEKSGAVLDRLYEAAQRINGITDTDVDDLEKNSEAARNGSSGSG